MKFQGKEYIIDLLNIVKRKGITQLKKFLIEESDYFTAPASTKRHCDFEGGLATHSLNVYMRLQDKIKRLNLNNITEESIIIVSLLHDLCKVNHYVRKKKHWVVNDELPLGHGPKSLAMALQLGLELTTEEMLAIRWHMGPRTPSTHMGWPDASDYKRAVKQTPLVTLLCTADMEASQVIEM